MGLESLILLAFAWGNPPADIAPQRADTMRQACAELVVQYAYSRDRLDYETYGNLFTEDAIFALAGQATKGRQAIVDALRARGTQNLTRHFSTPVSFEATSETQAKGLAYLQLFRAPAGTKLPGTYTEGPLIAEYHDEYEVIGSTCRFRSRRIKLVMGPAAD